MKPANSSISKISNTNNANKNYEVNIRVGSIGMIQLSGIYKQKEAVQKILNNWRNRGIRSKIIRNTKDICPKGNGKGYQLLVEADQPLVGFLNLFEGNTRDVAEIEDQVRAVRNFDVAVSAVTEEVADLI